MLSRRTIVKAGFTTFASLASINYVAALAQSGTPDANEIEFGNLLHQNLPELPVAAEGETEVVLVTYGTGTNAGILIHNATDQAVGVDDVTGIVRDSDGGLFAVVDRSILAPYELQPGEYGLGLVNFDKDISPTNEVELQVKTEVPGSSWSTNVDVPVSEVSVDTDSVVGVIENDTNSEVSSLTAVVGIFFDTNGDISGWFRTYLSDGINPGGIGTFSTSEIYGTISDSWAMAASD